MLFRSREGLSNIVALVIDRSQSMEIGTRKDDAEKALAAYRDKLKQMGVEVREAEVRTNADSGDTGGTALFAALNGALSEAPPDRVAGAIVKFVDAAGKPLKTGLAGKLNSEADFVVGYDGRAYLENLTASNAIAIEIEPGSCRAEFAYEARGDDQVVIGPVTCR